MTKQHFEHAARIVRAEPNLATRWRLCVAFTELFTAYNPRFDSTRFEAACSAEVAS